MGYELLPDFHGKGLMQEALSKVPDFGFAAMKLQTIAAWTIAPNLYSIKILERNLFKRDFELESNIYHNTDVADRVIYLLKNPVLNFQASHP